MTATPASPAIVAHRGASNDFPENTLAAFEEALRRGADAIELDVQLSRDGVPVVYHDRTLTRAGGGRRRVSSLDWSELRELDPGLRFDRRFRGQTLPSLEQVLHRFAKRTRLLIEIKAREGLRGAARHVELARSCARLVRHRRLELARKRFRNLFGHSEPCEIRPDPFAQIDALDHGAIARKRVSLAVHRGPPSGRRPPDRIALPKSKIGASGDRLEEIAATN